MVRVRREIRYDHTVAGQWTVPLRPPYLAAVAGSPDHRVWPDDSQVPPVSWRMLPPVLSPISARALSAGLSAAVGLDVDAPTKAMKALREKYGADEVVLTDSGTSALVLALRAVAGEGGTVAYPAYGCLELTTAALGAGVRVRLYDVDPLTLSPDLDSLDAAIARGVDAVVVAHLFAYPADMTGVRRLADARGIPVIEDAAQGSGGVLHGQKLGTLGDVAVVSFGRGKGTTAGSGGALLVPKSALRPHVEELSPRLGARTRGGREVPALVGQMVFSNALLYRLPSSVPGLKLGQMVFHPPRTPGAMTTTAAALLVHALAMEAGEIESRRARANILMARSASFTLSTPARPIAGAESGFLRLAMLANRPGYTPDTSLGMARGYPLTLEEHVQLKQSLWFGEQAGAGARELRDRLFTLPTHSKVRPSELSRLLAALGARGTFREAALTPVGAW